MQQEGGVTLRSIERPGARVSVRHRLGSVEVMVIEIGPHGSLVEPTLWDGASWHLVMKGQALFQQEGQQWEVLPDDSLSLPRSAPYSIANPSQERLKVLAIVARDSAQAEPEHSPDARAHQRASANSREPLN